MKTNRVKTSFIVLYALLLTGYIGFKATIYATLNKINRKWVDKTLHGWTLQILHLLRVNYKVINPHRVIPPKNRATMILCNHSSLFDIPLSYLAFPHHSMRMLAKKELLSIPFFGRGMTVAEFPSIDRKNRQQAIKDMRKIQALMESGIMVWIAPEGTRSKTGMLGPFKKGAFITAIEANAVIIPIGIRGANNILPAKTFKANFNQTAEIHIGEPIDAADFTLDNKEALMHQVRARMLVLLGQ